MSDKHNDGNCLDSVSKDYMMGVTYIMNILVSQKIAVNVEKQKDKVSIIYYNIALTLAILFSNKNVQFFWSYQFQWSEMHVHELLNLELNLTSSICKLN